MFLWPFRLLTDRFHIVNIIYKQEDEIGFTGATEAFEAPVIPVYFVAIFVTLAAFVVTLFDLINNSGILNIS